MFFLEIWFPTVSDFYALSTCDSLGIVPREVTGKCTLDFLEMDRNRMNLSKHLCRPSLLHSPGAGTSETKVIVVAVQEAPESIAAERSELRRSDSGYCEEQYVHVDVNFQ